MLEWIHARMDAPRQALQTPSVACPQCHTRYLLKDSFLIPRHLLAFLRGLRRWQARLVLLSAVGGVSAGIWLLAFGYGSAAFFMVLGPARAIDYFKYYSAPLLDLARALIYDETLQGSPGSLLPRLFQSWLKLAVGMPLIPVALLSSHVEYRSSLLQIALPAVLFDGPGSLSLRFPPTPNLTALVLPLLFDGYQTLRARLFQRLVSNRTAWRHVGVDPRMGALERDVGQDEEEMEEEERIETTARYILRLSEDSMSSLFLLPAASAALGWALFRSTGMHPFHRTCVGGGILLLASDMVSLLSQAHAQYLIQTRRVLDYTP